MKKLCTLITSIISIQSFAMENISYKNVQLNDEIQIEKFLLQNNNVKHTEEVFFSTLLPIEKLSDEQLKSKKGKKKKPVNKIPKRKKVKDKKMPKIKRNKQNRNSLRACHKW